VPGREPDVKASGQSTGGSLTVIEAMIDGGPPRHTHSREDESFYVLTGTLDVECGEDRFRAGPGVVCVPAAQPAARLPVRGWSGDSAANRDAGRAGRVLRGAVGGSGRECGFGPAADDPAGVRHHAVVTGARSALCAWMLRRDQGDRTEFITLSLWESVDAIRAFAGGDIEAAVLYPEDEHYLLGGESTVTHYQVVDQVEAPSGSGEET
jgi:hypothetical protein